MFWGTAVVEQAMKIMKNERISGGALVLLACTMFWVHGWADDKFAKVEDMEALQQTVEDGFERIDINDASAEIRDVKLSLQIAKATDPDGADVERIYEQLEHAVAYKKCLIERGSNCAHLREVE